LDATGGALGRRSALSAGVWVAVSVAARLGQKSVGFSDVADQTVRGESVSVHGDARRGRHGVGGSMPSWCVRSAGLGGVQAHGNMRHALCALGGSEVSIWHGRGGVYGGAQAKLAQGIGQGVQC
jgi:hypothetical protein